MGQAVSLATFGFVALSKIHQMMNVDPTSFGSSATVHRDPQEVAFDQMNPPMNTRRRMSPDDDDVQTAAANESTDEHSQTSMDDFQTAKESTDEHKQTSLLKSQIQDPTSSIATVTLDTEFTPPGDEDPMVKVTLAVRKGGAPIAPYYIDEDHFKEKAFVTWMKDVRIVDPTLLEFFTLSESSKAGKTWTRSPPLKSFPAVEHAIIDRRGGPAVKFVEVIRRCTADSTPNPPMQYLVRLRDNKAATVGDGIVIWGADLKSFNQWINGLAVHPPGQSYGGSTFHGTLLPQSQTAVNDVQFQFGEEVVVGTWKID